MKIINAQEQYVKAKNEIAIFLGGSCGSKNWRNDVIKFLKQIEKDKVLALSSMVLINPFIKNWNPTDEDLEKQIKWEAEMIDQSDIYSCYLDSSSEAAISLFELGRSLYQFKDKYANWNLAYRIIVSAHPEYARLKDLDFELKAITKNWKSPINGVLNEKNVTMHASKVLESYIKLSK